MDAIRTLARAFRPHPVSRENPVKGRSSTEFEVDNWAISDFVLHKLVPVVGTHPFPLHELMLMVAAVCRTEPSQIFEWGTNIGKSARILFECTTHYRIDTAIHSTDLPDDATHAEHPHQERGRLVRGLPGVHLHQGDGLETSLKLWREAGQQPRPLFFADGDHSYESVFRELRGISDSIPDASILVHDAFYQSAESGYNVGPHRAIGDLLEQVPGRYRRLDSGLGLPGLTLLYPAASA